MVNIRILLQYYGCTFPNIKLLCVALKVIVSRNRAVQIDTYLFISKYKYSFENKYDFVLNILFNPFRLVTLRYWVRR